MAKQTKFAITFDGQWPRWDGQPYADWLLGQLEWSWLIPFLHRALASPEEPQSWPRNSTHTELEEACSYWAAATYLCVVLLGWGDLGLGLQRLLSDGRPPKPSPHLDLLLQIWNDHDQLGLLGIWGWERSPQFGGSSSAWHSTKRSARTFLGEEWHERFLQQFPKDGVAFNHNPYYGGGDPLHLTGHVSDAFESYQGEPPALVQSGPDERRAVLMLDRMHGWMNALCRATQKLEDVAPHSWHVDVVVKPVGWLGTFRQSRVTGRWFAGTHTVHMMGSHPS
jgi:hypothetical protein